MDLINILWIFIILASLQPAIQRRFLPRARFRTPEEQGEPAVRAPQ